ncbi:type VII toxin-antitoxin system HepT family RNase toxin [Microbulbifer rhizosphaerae]|uniref:Uncharacterized protein YutE (UPF0331/DUF86 family) n=1 Tax=Microbulbifer rhizosphaerae TaxID=1562603 RepID=A0A7W4Z8R6_9GAMM|nr:DUF86 domain-containing protein [Microbulbifer rhizosphaerae]MBB3059440.1 uncharacterized protein YutE (UPF0331/DUF86 family) [Microbulbifer rhizosphaerae]
MNYKAYCDALTEQVSVHEELLKQISQKSTLGLLERTAAERSLQILAEAAIGATKHANRKLQLPERSDAANSVAQLLEHFPCPEVDSQEIRGAIGMRNAIVHDYLNLDWKLIQNVISTRQYLKLGRFVAHCCKLLRE